MIDARYLILLLSNIALIACTQLVNHGLSSTGISITPYGLLVVFPAIHLPVFPAFAIAFVSGLWIDAGHPSNPAVFVYALPLLTYLALRLRIKLQRENRFHGLLLAQALNGLLIFALALSFGFAHGASPVYWTRIAVDFAVSQLVLLLVTRWFFEFQYSMLRLAGIEILEDELETL